MDPEKNQEGASTFERESAHGKLDDTHGEVASRDLPEVQVDAIAERQLLRKLDIWIIPPVMLLYLFSFIDRVNIGNARLYGLEEDLSLTGDQYQIAVSILFATYITTEVPSNLVLKKFGPARWLAFITTGFGIVATMTGIVRDFKGLVVCRLVLGALEGGLFPGLTVYLTLFYTKKELALRIGYMFISSAIAGSVGGLLAYAIGFMDGVGGLKGWRWIFILEGIPTVALGISVLFWLANDPQSAHYLTVEERALAVRRFQSQTGHTASSSQMHKKDVLAAFRDWKIWAFAVGQFGVNNILYGYSTFLPTIIRSLGKWSSAEIQALTVPCYTLGAIFYLGVAWLSDRYQRRTIWIVIFGLIAASGYAILISPAPGGVKYFGCCVVGMGLYVIVGIPLAWLPTNNPRYGKRTVATGIQTTIGNSAGIAAPFLFSSAGAPRYLVGHGVSMGMIVMGAGIFGLMGLYFRRVNRQRDRGEEDSRVSGMDQEQIEELGEHNPAYRYTY